MGVLADLFIATADEAAQYQSSRKDLEHFQPLQYKGLTDIEFGILWSLLENQEWNVERHLLEEITFDDDCSLFQFQNDLLQLLSTITDTQLETFATQWSQTEELKESHWKYEATLKLLQDLNRLANKVIGTDKGLYLWVSL